ncbi:MAG: hypothetical protein MJ214_00900 [Bacilli bacterium]|nr:hypothetical protein [Bacilli bacterium]
MILMIFALFIISFSGVALFTTTTFQSIDNAFTTLNYSLPASWIVTDIEGPLPTPVYDTQIVEATSIEHLKNNLSHYVDKFQVGFYYFDSKSKEEMTDRYVTGVRISLRAAVPFANDYYKSTTYEIEETDL